MSGIHRCIFCLEESDHFNTVEHIIPESLGNTEDILYDAVCDKCQRYLGKEVENFVLSKSPFAFWRTIYGTKTKHGKEPFFDMSLDKEPKGRLPNHHPISECGTILHPAHCHDEQIVEAEFANESSFEEIRCNKKTSLKLVLTPKMLVYIGRFLGKIALEYWYKQFPSGVFNERFDALRKYVRCGTPSEIWPILYCTLNDNMLVYRNVNEEYQERTLYRYALFDITSMHVILFLLDIGCERYGMIIDNKYPRSEDFSEEFLDALLRDTDGNPKVFYYNL